MGGELVVGGDRLNPHFLRNSQNPNGLLGNIVLRKFTYAKNCIETYNIVVVRPGEGCEKLFPYKNLILITKFELIHI